MRYSIRYTTKITLAFSVFIFALSMVYAQKETKILREQNRYLYKYCQNRVMFRSSQVNLTFIAEGGTVELDSLANALILIPDSSNYTLVVLEQGKIKLKEVFEVMLAPPPVVKFYDSKGKEMNINTSKLWRTKPIEIKIIPDSGLLKIIPDVQYQLSSAHLYLMRGRRTVDQVNLKKGTNNIAKLWNKRREGDDFMLRIDEVSLMSPRGTINMVESFKPILLRLKGQNSRLDWHNQINYSLDN